MKYEFYNELTKEMDSISNRKQIVLLGDFNGRVGSSQNSNAIGPFGEGTVNDNGE